MRGPRAYYNIIIIITIVREYAHNAYILYACTLLSNKSQLNLVYHQQPRAR